MKRFSAAFAVALLIPVALSAQTWASWQLPSQCTGAVTGALGSATVSYTGPYNGVADASFNRCLSPSSPFTWNSPAINYFTANSTTAYAPLPDNASFIQRVTAVQLNANGSAYVPLASTLTFSQAVIDPYIAIISAGNNSGNTVTFNFGNAFEILSYDALGNVAPYWGNSNSVYALNTPMFSLAAKEFSGVIRFKGTFSSLSFTSDADENWNGFTVGASSIVSPSTSVVPEPTTWALTAIGLLGIGIGVRRRRTK